MGRWTWALLPVGAVLTTAAGFGAGVPWLLPVLGAAIPYPGFIRRVARGAYPHAVGWVLVWALGQTVAVGGATLLWPERGAEVVLQGAPYAEEMLTWIRTGVGPEGDPSLFLPLHARHFGAFCVLSFLTAGAGSLVLGTFLLNYMNFYVATLVAASAQPGLAALIGWPVWAEIRVIGFVTVGAALAGLSLRLLARIRPLPAPRFSPRTLVVGVGLVVLDAVLKATLATVWREWLVKALGGA